MKIYKKLDSEWIKTMRRGSVLLHPTDTIWGLGASAFSKKGFDKIYSLKGRDRSKPLVLLIDSIDRLKKYVHKIPPRIETLLFYNERPLTLIYSDVTMLPEHILAPDGSIAIRIVQKAVVRDLITELDQPILSTSANISDADFPKSFEDVTGEIKNGVDMIFHPDLPPADPEDAQPSVIARFDNEGQLSFLRK